MKERNFFELLLSILLIIVAFFSFIEIETSLVYFNDLVLGLSVLYLILKLKSC